ncbi:MAG: hypothetical protein QF662_07185, partial [Phycisphaerae bacterium]|nr:hypothetical protein [Phycisphaerae bacterium]
MLYYLVFHFKEFFLEIGVWKYLHVFRYLTFRTGFAVVTGFCLCILLAPRLIRFLRRLKVGSTVPTVPKSAGGGAGYGPEVVDRAYASKAGTPTMGGILMIGGAVLSVLLWADIGNFYVQLGLFAVVWLGVLGFVDDYLKMLSNRPTA